MLSSSLWLTKGTKNRAAAPLCTEGCSKGPTYLSPCSRRRPRFHSGWLFSRSPRCRRIQSRSLGRRRQLGSPLFRHLASRQHTGGTSPAAGSAIREKTLGEELGGGPGALQTKETIPPRALRQHPTCQPLSEGLRGLCPSICPAVCPVLSSGPTGCGDGAPLKVSGSPYGLRESFLGKASPSPKPDKIRGGCESQRGTCNPIVCQPTFCQCGKGSETSSTQKIAPGSVGAPAPALLGVLEPAPLPTLLLWGTGDMQLRLQSESPWAAGGSLHAGRDPASHFAKGVSKWWASFFLPQMGRTQKGTVSLTHSSKTSFTNPRRDAHPTDVSHALSITDSRKRIWKWLC